MYIPGMDKGKDGGSAEVYAENRRIVKVQNTTGWNRMGRRWDDNGTETTGAGRTGTGTRLDGRKIEVQQNYHKKQMEAIE